MLPYGYNTSVVDPAKLIEKCINCRPILDAQGNYNGWDTSQELAAHIDPYDPRLSAAYALAFAVDGSPTVFIEDLFDLGKLANRFTHNPKNVSQLPVRSDIANIIWCHQNLRFKDGIYKVSTVPRQPLSGDRLPFVLRVRTETKHQEVTQLHSSPQFRGFNYKLSRGCSLQNRGYGF